jgi:hypothetical protein
MSEQLVAETSTLQQAQETCIRAPAGFEPTITSKRAALDPHLDRAANGIGLFST